MKKKYKLCTALAGILSIAAPVYADDFDGSNSNSETIIIKGHASEKVTAATKTNTSIVSTPQTITLINQEELKLRNAQSINQAMTYVAGLTPNQRGGGTTRYDQLTLRGFTPGTYLDGMRFLGGIYAGPQADFNRIEEVVVLKGPASVLYGNSTPGGLINLVSKRAISDNFTNLELGIGNSNYKKIGLDTNRILNDNVNLRLVAGAFKNDGMVRYTENERYYLSPMVNINLSKDTKLDFIYTYQDDPQTGGYAGVPMFGTVLPLTNGKIPVDFNSGDPNYERGDRKQQSASLFLKQRLWEDTYFNSSLRFLNIKLSYRQMYNSELATIGTGVEKNTDYTTMIRGVGGTDEDFDTLTFDNNINAKIVTGNLKHDILIGVDYQKNEGENLQNFSFGTNSVAPKLNIFAPVYGINIPTTDLKALTSSWVNNFRTIKQTGLYLQDQVKIGNLNLIASARYDDYSQKSKNLRNNAITTLEQDAITARFGALYKFAGGFSPYYSYSESFEPQSGSTWDGKPFEPTTGRQHELGIKFQPKNSDFLFTLSAYDLLRQKVPIADPLAGTNGIPTSSQVQIGETSTKGFELETRGNIGKNWNITSSLTYMDAVFVKGAAASGITPSTTGTKPLGVPEWMASSFITYKFSDNTSLLKNTKIGLGARYVGETEGTTTYIWENGVQKFKRFTLDGFTVIDAVINYELGNISPKLENAELTLNITNLADSESVLCPFNNWCYYNAPRSIISTVRYKF